jgi:DNA-binding beta-propeller fold protein YncE
VADWGNARIQKFDSSGAILTKWRNPDPDGVEFYRPHGIAIDASNKVYVTDDDTDYVQKFSSSGAFITKWGSYGTGNGLFSSPWGITSDSAGNIYVADSGNNRIQKFYDSAAPRRARIGKVTVRGPASARKGKTATYSAKITNSGSAVAKGVRLRVSGRGISFNTSVGKIAAGKSRTVKVKLKPRKTGKVKVTFKVTSSNAGSKTVKKTVTVTN